MIYTSRYVLPVSKPYIENGAIVVQNDRIVDVGTQDEIKKKYPDEKVEDFELAALMPGFINCHTHLDHSVMRGLVEDSAYAAWKYQVMLAEDRMDEGDWTTSTMLGVLETLAAGITTVADITPHEATVRAVQEVGLRAIIYREVETMDKHQVDAVMDRSIADIDSWRSSVDPQRITIGIAAHSAYSCHPELFRSVARYAGDTVPVAIHLAGSKEEYEFVKYGSSRLAMEVRSQYDRQAPFWLPTGVSPVRYVLQWDILDPANVLAIHCTQVDDADLEILAKRDIAIAYCPRFNAKLGMGIAPLRRVLDNGLRVGIGTDSPAASNGMDMHEEMRTDLILQRAAFGKKSFFTAAEALHRATLGGAIALGIDDRVGSLEAGKQADIIAIGLSRSSQVPTHEPESAVVHSSHPHDVLMTMVDGNVLYRRGTHVGIDAVRVKGASEDIRLKLRTV
jgi:5-methylthioadenosine/S-adenosylhomocysteine deaminase